MVSTAYLKPYDRGEKDIQELRNLTSGKTTIVSFPLEEEEEATKKILLQWELTIPNFLIYMLEMARYRS